jgi:hypothetical protein
MLCLHKYGCNLWKKLHLPGPVFGEIAVHHVPEHVGLELEEYQCVPFPFIKILNKYL